jgi:hypothetical protein
VILDAGLLALAAMLETPIIAPLALIGTLLYAIGYFPSADLTGMQTAGVYVALYVPFAVAGWIVARRGKLGFTSAIVGAVAFAAMVIGIESSLHGEHNTVLAVTLLTIAVLHLAVAIITRSRYHSWLSAGALTFAIPAAFNGAAVNVAWAAEAAVLSIAGVRYRDDVLPLRGARRAHARSAPRTWPLRNLHGDPSDPQRSLPVGCRHHRLDVPHRRHRAAFGHDRV